MTVNDRNGEEIKPGYLVISGDEIGIVSKIHDSGAFSIRVPIRDEVRAWELGAPDVEESYTHYGQYDYRTGLFPDREERTRMVKDSRKIGFEKDSFYTKVRYTSHGVVILRKPDGTGGSAVLDAIEIHEKLFPAGESNG